jgi:hypothetical protein
MIGAQMPGQQIRSLVDWVGRPGGRTTAMARSINEQYVEAAGHCRSRDGKAAYVEIAAVAATSVNAQQQRRVPLAAGEQLTG